MKNTTDVIEVQEFYKLNNRNTDQFIGVVILNIKSELTKYQYDGRTNIEAKLTINLDFRDQRSGQLQSCACSFHAGFNNSNFYEYSASVSKHNPSGHGGIDIRPFKIQGHRVGTLMMSKVVSWLKTFPAHEKVHPISFVPSGDERIAKKFYKNAGIPVNGDIATINDLKVHQSWQSNIELIHQDQLQWQTIELYREMEFLKNQEKILRKQCIEVGSYVYTHNPLKALTNYPIEPNLLNPEVKNQIDTSHEKYESINETIIKYIDRNREIDILKSEINRLLKLISVHDKFHRTLILSGFCLLKIAKISLNSSFFPKPIKR